jgi:aryl-alcohol dehydrogenase-like predicted oxidoreductase
MVTLINKKNICPLGFGTWPLGGETLLAGKPIGHSKISDKEALDALNKSIELGVNFFDTADIYGLGAAENLLGQALKGRRDNAVICTKFGNRELEDGSLKADFSATWLETCVEGSLKRLQTDHLDILLLHGPSDATDWSKFDPEPFEKMITSGKILRYGISSHSVYGAESVLDAGIGSVIEVIYNAMDRRIAEKLLPQAEKDNTFVIARVPLAKGFISEKYCKKTVSFPKEDHRSLISNNEKAWLLESAEKLSFLSELPGGMAISGLRFCLSESRIGAVIPGMSSLMQVEENFKAIDLGPLPDDILAKIAAAVPEVYSGWKKK